MSQIALFPELDTSGATPDATSDEWFTPRWFLRWLPTIAIDPCHNTASGVRALAVIDLRAGGDGLRDEWAVPAGAPRGSIVFCNPPYSDCATWVERCATMAERLGVPVVALVPGYAGDQYWHRAVWGRASWVGFIGGRVRFDTVNGRAKDAASFTSAVICWGEPRAAHQVLEYVQARREEAPQDPGFFAVNAASSLLVPMGATTRRDALGNVWRRCLCGDSWVRGLDQTQHPGPTVRLGRAVHGADVCFHRSDEQITYLAKPWPGPDVVPIQYGPKARRERAANPDADRDDLSTGEKSHLPPGRGVVTTLEPGTRVRVVRAEARWVGREGEVLKACGPVFPDWVRVRLDPRKRERVEHVEMLEACGLEVLP